MSLCAQVIINRPTYSLSGAAIVGGHQAPSPLPFSERSTVFFRYPFTLTPNSCGSGKASSSPAPESPHAISCPLSVTRWAMDTELSSESWDAGRSLLEASEEILHYSSGEARENSSFPLDSILCWHEIQNCCTHISISHHSAEGGAKRITGKLTRTQPWWPQWLWTCSYWFCKCDYIVNYYLPPNAS